MARPSDIVDENPIDVSPDLPAFHAVLKEVHELLSTKPVEPYDDIPAADDWVVGTCLVLGRAALVTVNLRDEVIDKAIPWFKTSVDILSEAAQHVQKALNTKKGSIISVPREGSTGSSNSTKKRDKKPTRNKNRPHLPARFRQKPTPPTNSTTPNQDVPDLQGTQDLIHDEATESSPKRTRLRTRVIPDGSSSPSETVERQGADDDNPPSRTNTTAAPALKIGPPRRAKRDTARMAVQIAPPSSKPAVVVPNKSRGASQETGTYDESEFPPLDGREPLLVKTDKLLEQFKQRKRGNTSFRASPLNDIPPPGPNDPAWVCPHRGTCGWEIKSGDVHRRHADQFFSEADACNTCRDKGIACEGTGCFTCVNCRSEKVKCNHSRGRSKSGPSDSPSHASKPTTSDGRKPQSTRRARRAPSVQASKVRKSTASRSTRSKARTDDPLTIELAKDPPRDVCPDADPQQSNPPLAAPPTPSTQPPTTDLMLQHLLTQQINLQQQLTSLISSNSAFVQAANQKFNSPRFEPMMQYPPNWEAPFESPSLASRSRGTLFPLPGSTPTLPSTPRGPSSSMNHPSRQRDDIIHTSGGSYPIASSSRVRIQDRSITPTSSARSRRYIGCPPSQRNSTKSKPDDPQKEDEYESEDS